MRHMGTDDEPYDLLLCCYCGLSRTEHTGEGVAGPRDGCGPIRCPGGDGYYWSRASQRDNDCASRRSLLLNAVMSSFRGRDVSVSHISGRLNEVDREIDEWRRRWRYRP